MDTTRFTEAREIESRSPVGLVIFILAALSVFALALAPHRIGVGF